MGKAMDYNSFAAVYSETRYAYPGIAKILIDEFKTLTTPAHIIEIGCGTGNYIIELTKSLPGNIYMGFDLSEEMLKIAKSRTVNVEFQQANADIKFPYDDDSAHGAFLVDVIHHIEKYKVFFDECKRILKHSGILIIITDTEDDFYKRSGTKYFPETLRIELERYPTVYELDMHAENSVFKKIYSKHIEDRLEIDDSLVSAIARKRSSSLRLLPEEFFQAGLQRVREAKLRGEKWLSSYTILKYLKI
jgi:ubiquinone/menaquinone biosynthesis C-methylase UbiE